MEPLPLIILPTVIYFGGWPHHQSLGGMLKPFFGQKASKRVRMSSAPEAVPQTGPTYPACNTLSNGRKQKSPVSTGLAGLLGSVLDYIKPNFGGFLGGIVPIMNFN